jgi:photosystem II stability/assembly factor-like uncharacterized protein
MTNHQSLERRMREANPVPALDALHHDELLAARSLLESRRGVISSPGKAPRQAVRWRKPVFAAAAAFLVTISAGTAAYFAFGRGEKPTTVTSLATTTVAEVTTSLEEVTTTVPAPIVIPEGAVFTWTRVEDTTGALTDAGNEFVSQVIAGGPGLVAVGADDSGCDWGPWWQLYGESGFSLLENAWTWQCGGAVWLSADGESWTRVPDPDGVFSVESGVGTLTGIADNGSRLVAVGVTGTESPDPASAFGPRAGVWVSDDDGTTWTRVPHDEAVFGGEGRHLMLSVIATDFGFVAAGDELWSSPDGWTWTRLGPMRQVRRMARTPDGYVAVGACDNACAWTSPDGLSWRPAAITYDTATEPDTTGMFDVAVGPAGLVAVGSQGLMSDMNWDAAVWLAEKEGEWSWVQGGAGVFAKSFQQELQGVTVVADRLVAVGAQNSHFNVFGPAQSWVSDDGGRTWSRVESEELGGRGDNIAMTAVATLGNKVIAMGYEAVGSGGADVAVWIGTWE